LVRSEAQKLRKGWKELPARVFSNENGNLPDPDNFRCSFFRRPHEMMVALIIPLGRTASS